MDNLDDKGHTAGETDKGRSVKVQGVLLVLIVDGEILLLYCIYDIKKTIYCKE